MSFKDNLFDILHCSFLPDFNGCATLDKYTFEEKLIKMFTIIFYHFFVFQVCENNVW